MAASNMKQHFIYPVRLTKILLGIYYGSTTNNSNKKISTNNNKNKISTNSHLLNQLQLCHKRDQQNVDEDENNFNETATLYGASKKKVVELLPEHVSHPAFGLQLC